MFLLCLPERLVLLYTDWPARLEDNHDIQTNLVVYMMSLLAIVKCICLC